MTPTILLADLGFSRVRGDLVGDHAGARVLPSHRSCFYPRGVRSVRADQGAGLVRFLGLGTLHLQGTARSCRRGG
jgi:hypothetical protein